MKYAVGHGLVILFFLHPIIFLFILMFLETPCRKQIRYKNYLLYPKNDKELMKKWKLKDDGHWGSVKSPRYKTWTARVTSRQAPTRRNFLLRTSWLISASPREHQILMLKKIYITKSKICLTLIRETTF